MAELRDTSIGACGHRRMLHALEPVAICDQFCHLIFRQCKHECRGKSFSISFHLLIQSLCRHSVEFCKVSIKHNLDATDRKDSRADGIGSHIIRNGQIIHVQLRSMLHIIPNSTVVFSIFVLPCPRCCRRCVASFSTKNDVGWY